MTSVVWLILAGTYVLAWLIIAAQGLVISEILRQLGQIRHRVDLDDRPIPLSLAAVAGRRLPATNGVNLPGLTSAHGIVLLLSSECASCTLVAASVSVLARTYASQVTFAAVVQAVTHSDGQRFVLETGLPPELASIDVGGKFARSVAIDLRPAALLVRDGVVVDGVVARNAGQLELFVKRALEQPSRSPDETSGEHGTAVRSIVRGGPIAEGSGRDVA